jgi:hypothetical protein
MAYTRWEIKCIEYGDKAFFEKNGRHPTTLDEYLAAVGSGCELCW